MLNVIYEDKDKIIVNKPAGQLSQSARGFDMDLVSEVLTYRKNKGEEAYAAIINRLDRPVSGLVLIAKNKKEAARLSALMQRESLCKQYLVLVCGRPHSDTCTFTDYLLKNGKDNTSKVVSKEQAGASAGKIVTPKGSIVAEEDSNEMKFVCGNLLNLSIKPLDLSPPKCEGRLKQDCETGCQPTCEEDMPVCTNSGNNISDCNNCG